MLIKEESCYLNYINQDSEIPDQLSHHVIGAKLANANENGPKSIFERNGEQETSLFPPFVSGTYQVGLHCAVDTQ